MMRSSASHTAPVYLPRQNTAAFRNQRDEAFVWPDRAYAQHEDDLPATSLLPELKNLHGNPRYIAFLKTIHLSAI
jgi:hypothetical protein